MELKEARKRHCGIVDMDELNVPITVIGAGSIGSFAVLTLAKLGCQDITVYDHDSIEIHNVGCQLFGESSIGQKKVDALQKYIKELTGINIKVVPRKWKTNKEKNPLIISAVDSLKKRETIWKKLKDDLDIIHYIDARMGGEFMRIYTVDMGNQDKILKYEKSLIGRKAAPIPCTERSIVYNVMISGGIIGQQVKKLVKNQDFYKEIIIDLPSLEIIKSF